MIRYRFSGEPMRVEDRFVNPLGFQVTRYRRDPEALPPPSRRRSPCRRRAIDPAASVGARARRARPPPHRARLRVAPEVAAVKFAAFLLRRRAAVAAPATAQVRPTPGAGDPRIQTVLYDPDQVVQLQVAPGYQLTVEFAPDERIETVAVGDSGAWQVTPNKRGDRLFIRPSGGGVTTNMTVVTDARAIISSCRPAMAGAQAYTVRFTYPPPPRRAAERRPVAEPGRYKLSGDEDAAARRDLRRRRENLHRMAAPTRRLPAVFAIDRDGKETLVNGTMRDGALRASTASPTGSSSASTSRPRRAARVPQVRG